MTAIVIADAGPLIGLARIDRLSLLHSLYGSVVVPEAVIAELQVDSQRPGAQASADALAQAVLQPRALPTDCEAELSKLSRLLDPGEASAILLAERADCHFLLIDERRGRQVAKQRGITVVGLAGILLVAKRAGLLSSVTDVLSELTQQGYRLSDALLAEVLRLANEQTSRE